MIDIDIDPWREMLDRHRRAKTRRIAIIAGCSLLAVLAVCVTVLLS